MSRCSHDHQKSCPVCAAKSASSQQPATKRDIDALRDKLAELISKKPEKAAIVLTEWLKQGSSPASKRPTKKKAA